MSACHIEKVDSASTGGMPPAARRYLWEFGAAMAVYSLAVAGLRPWVAHQFEGQNAIVLAGALSPIVPAIFALLAVLRFAATWDELQQRKMMEALLIAFVVCGFGFFTYGFLEDLFLPQLSMIWVFPAMIATMGLAQIAVWLRYR